MRAIIAVALLSASVAGQRLVVRGPEPATISLGEAARVVLVAEGVDSGGGLVLGPLPRGDDVRIVAPRPETRVDVVERAGESVEVTSLVWTIEVRPLRSGTLRLGKFSVVGPSVTLESDPLALDVVRPLPADLPVRLDVVADRESVFVGEAVRVRLRLRYDAGFMREKALQPFRSRLDVPVQITARFLESIPGAAVAPAVGSGATTSVSLNGEFVDLELGDDETVDDVTWKTAFVERVVKPRRAGVLDLGEPFARVIHAAGFTEDFFGSRNPTSRRVVVLGADVPRIEVRGVPRLGRPADFDGALGTFELAVHADTNELTAHEEFSVVVAVTGDGDPATVSAPRLTASAGLHVLGVLDRGISDGVRTFVFDMVARDASIVAIPAFVLTSFEPGPGRFVTARSEPVAIRVSPAAAPVESAAPDAKAPIAGSDDIFVEVSPTRGDPASLSTSAVAAAAIAPWIAFALWLLLRRRAAGLESDPSGYRARRAAAAFRRRVRRGAEPAEALVEYLAARLRRPRAAVVSFELDRALLEAGVGGELAGRAGAVMFERSAARFGAAETRTDAAAIGDLVDGIEAVFTSGGRG